MCSFLTISSTNQAQALCASYTYVHYIERSPFDIFTVHSSDIIDAFPAMAKLIVGVLSDAVQ